MNPFSTHSPRLPALRRSVAMLFALIALAALCGCTQSTNTQSDAEMLRHFAAHRQDFQKIVAMMRTDSRLQHVARDSIAPADAIGESRLREYRDFLDRLALERVSNVDGSVKLATQGTRMLSYDKGYLCASSPPSPLSASLDLEIKDLKPLTDYYKHIDGEWYLYFHNPWD